VTNSKARPWGLRHGLWIGAACLLVLAVVVRTMMGASAPGPSPVVSLDTSATVRQPSAEEATRVMRPKPPESLPGKAVAALPKPPQKGESPPLSAHIGEPKSLDLPSKNELSDPFEPQQSQEPEVRTLVSVGDIQLGVVRNSRIRDEAGLKKALVRIGDDLEKRLRGLQPLGVSGLQQVLDGYREELGRYMDGEVELRGPDWMIGTEVGPPPPREEWWVPRKQ